MSAIPVTPRLRFCICRQAFSLLETLIAIAVISVIAALVIPVTQDMWQKARSSQCQSNLRQIGAAIALYRADNNSSLPKVYDSATGHYWFHQLLGVTPATQGATYLGSAKVLACPSNPKTTPTFSTTPPTAVGYGMFDALLWHPSSHRSQDDPRLLLKVVKASDWPLIMDGDKLAIYSLDNPTAQSAGDARFAARHNGVANILMADGHVRQASYGETRWKQQNLNSASYFGQ